MVPENTVAISLLAGLPSDQLSSKFEDIGGDTPTPPNRQIPGMSFIAISDEFKSLFRNALKRRQQQATTDLFFLRKKRTL